MERRFSPKSARLMDQVREVLRFHHYSISTEKSYVSWILKYIRFNNRRHSHDVGKEKIEWFQQKSVTKKSKHQGRTNPVRT